MTDNERPERLPSTAAETQEVMDRLEFDAPPSTPAEEAELLAQLPPAGSPIMTVRSLRMPIELAERVSKAAEKAGIPKTAWIRQAIEAQLAEEEEDTRVVSLADVRRALSLVRPAQDHAA
ncbi:ribbon-helix-helix protein, CopG family [Stackebrandtia nassauensis]|uniref:Uncharacterized protein n=1 Tax=Stackebrandtia nassauensis (strain DSM 44728 / CIP 108903 / NRRL B-16338 / NBRC 102104 / LLR-40K-21) TaxID=446470 RepID=D3Q2W2_STANL|nr:ribbon-helix-helix protein, CopG family [Stackebrandtia nassauensis]ADD45863.1 hypothetical protein Snas_6242 [Stackebrandtia nassauensis DSM 44728]